MIPKNHVKRWSEDGRLRFHLQKIYSTEALWLRGPRHFLFLFFVRLAVSPVTENRGLLDTFVNLCVCKFSHRTLLWGLTKI